MQHKDSQVQEELTTEKASKTQQAATAPGFQRRACEFYKYSKLPVIWPRSDQCSALPGSMKVDPLYRTNNIKVESHLKCKSWI